MNAGGRLTILDMAFVTVVTIVLALLVLSVIADLRRVLELKPAPHFAAGKLLAGTWRTH